MRFGAPSTVGFDSLAGLDGLVPRPCPFVLGHLSLALGPLPWPPLSLAPLSLTPKWIYSQPGPKNWDRTLGRGPKVNPSFGPGP